MKQKLILAAAALIMTGMVAGCGSSSTSSDSSTSTIAGKVADGYLVGATVFLDKNGNYLLDSDEPSATTDADGAYSLAVDPADLGRYHIVALAIQGVTIDKDFPDQTVANSYLLSLPRYSVSGTVSSNFISPISSQLREMMETGRYETIQQAMEELRIKLGMPVGTNMSADYLAGIRNEPMHTAAQNMASLMGGQMTQVFTGGSTTTLDVNRYRGMMGAIFSNISCVRVPDAGASMEDLRGTMTATLGGMTIGEPYRNMSSSFQGMAGGGRTGTAMGGPMGR